MGYRHYFFLVDKAECEAVRDMDFPTLCQYAEKQGAEMYDEEDGGDFYFNDKLFLNKKEVFEFGKLYWDDTAERIYSKGTPLFSDEETWKQMEYYKPYVVGKEGMLKAIEIYEEKIINYYAKLAEHPEEAQKHIKDMLRCWSWHSAVCLEEDCESISSSWYYEHEIFELVRLYKSIDWDKKTVLFYGW